MLGKQFLGGKGGSPYYEGRCYFKKVYLYKQYRIHREVNISGFRATMKTRIADFREDPSCTNLDELMNEEEFLSFIEEILKTSNTMSQMMTSYIKQVGDLLALISSVQESTIERRKDERVMLQDTFVFVHPNHGTTGDT